MNLLERSAICLLMTLPVLSAQEPTAPAPPTPAAPPVLEYAGKAIVLPYQCSVEDTQAAGLSCSEEEPCPIYLELTAVESLNNTIVAAGNIHSAAVTLFTVLLVSDDLGHTWRETAPRVAGAGIDRIQFLDAQDGWAAGEVLSPLARDPFLLLTTDGGKSWRERSIFGESREDHFGSIQQFLFTDKESGSLIVDRGHAAEGDRYELFDSQDGGESWNPKETSTKPLRLKRTPAPATEWRARADARTQSYHIEHNQGNRWNTVAAFSVKLAPCKPQ